MLRTMTGILFALAFGLASAHAQEKKSPQWAVAALSVRKIAPDEPPSGLISAQHTLLTVRLEASAGMIAGVNLKKSTMTTFCDDKNTDLLRDQEKSPFSVSSDHLALDGQRLFVTIRSSALPAPSAKKLRVKGAIAVDMATEEKTLEMKDVSLVKGVDLKFGVLQLPKRPKTKNKSAINETVAFNGNRPIKKMVFLNAAGNEIPIQSILRRESKNANTDDPYSMYFHFGGGFGVRQVEKVDRCTIRVTYYEKVELRMVPIDLEVGFGF